MQSKNIFPILGMNTVSDTARQHGNFVRLANNVNINANGTIELRAGKDKVTDTPISHLWQSPLHKDVFGLYDGYFGPGTGTFFSLSQVVLRGRDLVQATARAKLLNFATNIASLIFFVLGGQVVWVVGLVMMTGQLIGAYLGSHMVVKGGAKFIRPVIVVVCFCMVAKLLWG